MFCFQSLNFALTNSRPVTATHTQHPQKIIDFLRDNQADVVYVSRVEGMEKEVEGKRAGGNEERVPSIKDEEDRRREGEKRNKRGTLSLLLLLPRHTQPHTHTRNKQTMPPQTQRIYLLFFLNYIITSFFFIRKFKLKFKILAFKFQ